MTTAVTPAPSAIAAWLAELIARRGIRQGQLAAYIGVRASAVSDWLAGKKTPRPDMCRRLARFAGVPEEDVLRIAGHMEAKPAVRAPPRPRFLREEALELLSALPFEVPVYEDFPIHAGQDGIAIQIVYLPPMSRKPGTVVGLIVKGRCMEPEIREGDTVVLDLEAEVEDGDVVAVGLEDSWVLRRCWFRDGGFRLECDNPEAPADGVAPDTLPRMYPVIDVRKGRPKRRPPAKK